MDITLAQRSIFDLPSQQRVGCIVYDGTADMQLWPGPGSDSEISGQFGPDMQRALDTELKQVEGRRLTIPSVIRVHPGRLHCNFLLWVATREPEPGVEQMSAPGEELLTQGVLHALRFAAQRSVERIAFPALGGGKNELPRAERLAIIARAAHSYQEECTKLGCSPVIEEVLICDAGAALREAQRKVHAFTKTQLAEERKSETLATSEKRTSKSAKASSRSAAATATPKRASSVKTASVKKAVGPTESEIAEARIRGPKYDMRQQYRTGEVFGHPKFGVGKVLAVDAPSQMTCLFEDGVERKLVHGRV